MDKKLIFAFSLLFLLSGCLIKSDLEERREEIALKFITPVDLISINYHAADGLIAQLQGKIDPSQPILVATIVNTDDLYLSSTLGRSASEQIASRFTQNGYRVIEMKFGKSVYMKTDTGELVLTREIKSIMNDHNAQGVIVGSYGIGEYEVYMNVKLVNPDLKNSVLASQDYSIYKNAEIKKMLKSSKY